MRTPRIFIDLPLTENQELALPSSRAHYVRNVLRLSAGRSLLLFNGKGGEFEASLTSSSKKGVTVTISRHHNIERESPLHTELAIGVSKGDRMDWIVQKATELGVNAITPLMTERSEVKLNAERWQKKLNHWREIIIGACEQCGRNKVPIMNDPSQLHKHLPQFKQEAKLVLHPFAAGNLKLDSLDKPAQVALLIGPEGGFSDAEVTLVQQANFKLWSLGPRVLRTETAPMVALSLLQSRFGDI